MALAAQPNGATIAIEPADGLDLAVLAKGAAARFANLFRQTWRRIPRSDRQCMLRHWRVLRADAAGFPTIQYADRWSDHQFGEIANTSLDGRQLRFKSTAVDTLPDSAVCDLIAHELAHVYLIATKSSPPPSQGKQLRHTPAELRADGLARSWGFEPDSIGIWDALVQ
jgi:hypothetical protein